MKEFIEKLIGRLEELRNDKYMNGVSRFTPNEKKVFDIAETIVKQLAEEYNNDVCEWQWVKNGEFIQNPHTNRKFSHEPSMRNVYCNTCGKKIKVAPYQPKGE